MPRANDIYKDSCGVWMVSRRESVARFIAVAAMRSLGIDVNDFRKRDKVINAIASEIDEMLDQAASQFNGDA